MKRTMIALRLGLLHNSKIFIKNHKLYKLLSELRVLFEWLNLSINHKISIISNFYLTVKGLKNNINFDHLDKN